MPASSYDASASHRDLESELERLRLQATAGWRKERRLLEAYGLRDGMTILEVGCGPGFVTQCLRQAYPSATITAVEVDPLLAATARERLETGCCGHVRIVTGPILDSGLAPESFDFAIARLVFQHLTDPVANARAIEHLLRPGGHLAIIDCDDGLWGMADPSIPELPAVLEAYGAAQAASGGDRYIGRRLLRVLAAAGFVNLEIDGVLNHSDELGLDALLPHLDPDRVRALVQSNLLPERTLSSFSQSVQHFASGARQQLAFLLVVAHGCKTASPEGGVSSPR